MPIIVGDTTGGRTAVRLDSTGSTWFGNSSGDMHNIQGALYLTGAAVFNMAAASDGDFTVKSTTSTHMFFVDSSAGRIGIGTSSPDNTLHVKSAGTTHVKVESDAGYEAALKLKSGGQSSAYIWQPGSTSDLRFYINGADRLAIESGGAIVIGPSTLSLTEGTHYGSGMAGSVSAVQSKLTSAGITEIITTYTVDVGAGTSKVSGGTQYDAIGIYKDAVTDGYAFVADLGLTSHFGKVIEVSVLVTETFAGPSTNKIGFSVESSNAIEQDGALKNSGYIGLGNTSGFSAVTTTADYSWTTADSSSMNWSQKLYGANSATPIRYIYLMDSAGSAGTYSAGIVKIRVRGWAVA